MKIFCLLVFLCLFSRAAFAEGFLCVADDATGFHYNETTRTWQQTRFVIEGKKHIIRRPIEADNPDYDKKWVVTEFGSTQPHYFCPDEINDLGVLKCQFVGTFIFNSLTLRYIKYSQGGYTSAGVHSLLPPEALDKWVDEDNLFMETMWPNDSSADTPYMEIGTCTKI